MNSINTSEHTFMPTHPTLSHQHRCFAKNCRNLGKRMVVFSLGMLAIGLASVSVATIPSNERLSLESLYGNTDGQNWINTVANNQPWFINADECTWFGIVCSDVANGPQHVIQINLYNNNLRGNSSSMYLGYLTQLQLLDVSTNQLTAFPSLTGLSQLRTLSVSGNYLTQFPDLAGLTALQSINVSYNTIHSLIPSAPGTLLAGASALCPNPLDLSPSANDPGWDIATGAVGTNHWWNKQGPGTGCDPIFTGNFES